MLPRFLVNTEACINLGNCTIDFFDEIRQMGRDQNENYTVDCYFDEFLDVALYEHEPDAQQAVLYIAAIVPPFLLVFSCLLMYIVTSIVKVRFPLLAFTFH